MEPSWERRCSEKKQLRLSGIQRQPLFSGQQWSHDQTWAGFHYCSSIFALTFSLQPIPSWHKFLECMLQYVISDSWCRYCYQLYQYALHTNRCQERSPREFRRTTTGFICRLFYIIRNYIRSTGRVVISRCGTACVRPAETESGTMSIFTKRIIFPLSSAHLHNGPAHAGSQRVLLYTPHQCWTLNWPGFHRAPDAPCSAHSVQSPHTWLLSLLEGPKKKGSHAIHQENDGKNSGRKTTTLKPWRWFYNEVRGLISQAFCVLK